MNKVQHPSNNAVLGAPPGMSIDECTALPITRVQYENNCFGVRSYWKPTEDELALLNSGGYVCLEVLGITMPPVILTAER